MIFMSEDRGEVKNSEKRERLHDVDRALKSIQRGQEKGKWSTPKPAYTGEPVPPQTEKKYPTQEEREEALAKMPGEETVPLEIKEELTEETKRIHTTAMEGGEKKQAELPKVKPFIEEKVAPSSTQAPEILKARGGAEPLKRILEAQKKLDREKAALKESASERAKARIKQKQVEVPFEAKSYRPASQIPKDEEPTPQPTTEPVPQKAAQVLKPERKPFFSRVFRKILGKR
jgi:hypothetical protein